jgi:hypothetical protein
VEFGKIWRCRLEELECCKHKLMGNLGKNSEDQTAIRNMDSDDCNYEDSDEKNYCLELD